MNSLLMIIFSDINKIQVLRIRDYEQDQCWWFWYLLVWLNVHFS